MKSRVSIIRIATLAIMGITFFSCSKDSTDDSSTTDDIPRTTIEMTRSMENLVRGANLFSYRLLQHEVNAESGSFMVSPLSLSFVLSMAMEAVEDGENRDNVINMLGFGSVSQEEIREYCSTMLRRLPDLSRTTTVTLANFLAADSRLGNLNTDFEETIKSRYEAKVECVPFNDPVRVADLINKWASEKTKGVIDNVVDENNVAGMDLCLANALYFKGIWTSPFKKSRTSEETFTRENAVRIKLPMMKQSGNFAYSENSVCKAIRLHYGNGAYAMNLILPKAGYSVKDAVDLLAEGDNLYLDAEMAEVDLWLPRFSDTGKKDLTPAIRELSGGSIDRCAFKVFQNGEGCLVNAGQAYFIKVDESGTEAAVGSFGGVAYDLDLDRREFHADHPFIYTITETSTGAVLFAGVFRGGSQ